MKNTGKTTFSDNEIILEINTKIYPKEVIYKTCYIFVDQVFIHLDIVKKGSVRVLLKSKKDLDRKQLENMKREFSNELLNVLLRDNVSRRNKKVVEYIVSGAIAASLRGIKTESDEVLLLEKKHLKENKESEKAVKSLRRELAKFDTENA